MAEVTSPIITDDTGQDIKIAINGLATALGTNKADIDGSNIANPSAFRQAIGLTTSTTTLTSPASQIFRQYIKMQNGIVYIYLDFNNFKSTTAQTIGYLPEGYRPFHQILKEVIVISADDDSFKGYAHFTIRPTGEITLKMQGSYAHSFCTLDVSFPISNT